MDQLSLRPANSGPVNHISTIIGRLNAKVLGQVYNAKMEDMMCQWKNKVDNLFKRSFIPSDRIMEIRCSPPF